MNFLTPLFLAGAVAVAGPIIFHLIRRAARERTQFSSVMFLKPTPPRTVKRRNLEHLWLLLLRCLCVLLLATGFARPFFSRDQTLPENADEGRQYVLLLDTSASMKRAGVWDKARAVAQNYLDKASSSDELAVMTFDRQLRTVVSLTDWKSWTADQRASFARQRLATVSPDWLGTQLGSALTGAAEQFQNSPDGKSAKQRILVLISDLQEGAKLDGLQGHEWPTGTRVVVERVAGKAESNAGLEILEQATDATGVENDIHVRLANSADSQKEKFRLNWDNGGNGLDIYLPPGQSRTFTAPKLSAGTKTGKLQLTGDEADFDNNSYYTAPEVEDVSIAYLGSDATNDPNGLRYYLDRVFLPTPRRQVRLVSNKEMAEASFAIIPGKLSPEESASVKEWISGGKSALFVLTNADMGTTLAALLGLPDAQISEANGEFALLGQIDFKHPIFAPFDDPRFSDFSHIHFWKHRRWEIPSTLNAQIVAKFDDAAPAIVSAAIGKGQLLVMTSGWGAADSQLAVSSKFPPLMQMMLQWSGVGASARFQFRTGDVIPSPAISGGPVQWQKPDGKNLELAAGTAFSDTDQPGIYHASWNGKQRAFAVNLPLEESRVAPLGQDELARLGVPIGPAVEQLAKNSPARQRQVQQSELENRQKLWRWMLVGALVMLFGEIILSGWLASRVPKLEEGVA